MASELRVNTLKDASGNNSIATSFVAGGSAKAWSFTTDDVITDSLNTSSSADNGTGDYTITFASAMANVTFAVTTTVNEHANFILGNRERDTGSFRLRAKNTSGTGVDSNAGSAVHGDLA